MNDLEEQLVSIGLPVYNGQRFLRRALDSLLVQDYKNFELIISDNASTDETSKICLEYAQKDKRIKYIRQKENTGMLKNFTFVLQQSKGKYFMWAAYDDIWAPSFISTLKTALDKHPGHDIAMSSLILIKEDGTPYQEIKFIGNDNLTNISHYKVLIRLFVKKTPLYFIHGLFRSDFLKRIMRRINYISIGLDKIIIAEASLATHFCSVPDILFKKTVIQKSKAEDYMIEFKGMGGWFYNKYTLRYIWKTIEHLMSSPLIPLRRKILVPFLWLIQIVSNRYEIIKELSPKSYAVLRKIKKALFIFKR